jgi:hypothetical protein
MRLTVGALCMAFLIATVWAQANPAAPQDSPSPPRMHCAMRSQQSGMSMPNVPTPDVKAQLDIMRTKLAQMKAVVAKIKDPALKEQSQLDIDLWESMIDHMQAMIAGMPSNAPIAMGAGPGGMGCCARMRGSMTQGGCCCAGMMNGSGGKCMKPAPATKSSAPGTPGN